MRTSKVIGLIKRHPDGFGFLIPEESDIPDIYIPRHSLEGVMTGDRVEATVVPENRERYRGEIHRIIRRGTISVVGIFKINKDNKDGYLADVSQAWGTKLSIAFAESMDAKDGDFVTAQVLSYPSEPKGFCGKVLSILKNPGDPLNDIHRVAASQSLPQSFSREAIEEAERWGLEVPPNQVGLREDLRALHFVTIDGATAKDFDDAIFVDKHSRGFTAWVAIADVSHYVPKGGRLDQDAYERGTSVYFPNYVIPMLPPALSDHLCSLRPNVARLALVAKIEVSHSGEIQSKEFMEAVIESQARLTYGEAQDILEGAIPKGRENIIEDVRKAADLAKILMRLRERRGSLDLEIPEVELEIDAAGEPVDVIRSERLFTHKMIEELMLLANVAVAEFISDHNIPCLYRIHEPPKPEAILILSKYLQQFGSGAALNKGTLQKKINEALEEFKHRPEAQILNILALRAMSQARYSSRNVGHFGLGFSHYAHFTSPIRRYPDLIVHRMVKVLIKKRPRSDIPSEEDMASAGTLLSACEQRAVKAERQIQSIKKARFLERHLGEEFDGIISSVARFGIFVLLREYEVDGLVHIEKMAKDKLIFDEERLVLFGKRNGVRYAIGDKVRIRVEKADHETGKVDFELLAHESSTGRVESASIEGRAGESGTTDARVGKHATKNKKNGRRESGRNPKGEKSKKGPKKETRDIVTKRQTGGAKTATNSKRSRRLENDKPARRDSDPSVQRKGGGRDVDQKGDGRTPGSTGSGLKKSMSFKNSNSKTTIGPSPKSLAYENQDAPKSPADKPKSKEGWLNFLDRKLQENTGRSFGRGAKTNKGRKK